MRTLQRIRKHAPRLLLTLTAFMALSLSMFAPVVGADTTPYTAAQIETWLEDAVTGTEVTVTNSPVVELTPAIRLLKVTTFSFAVRGITVGLSELRVTCDGSKTVAVVGELDVLGKLPRFSCSLEMEYLNSIDKLRVANISNIVIADSFTPALSPGDIATIVDVVNQILDSSELSVTSPPGGDLAGIDVVESDGAKLEATWTTGDPSYIDAAGLGTKLNGMADALAAKATDYLAAGEGDWTIGVNVVADTSLDIDAVFTAFSVTASLDASVTFDTLTATITDATLSVGSKSVTFSAAGEIGCSAGDPSIAMTSLTVGDEYPGFRDFIEDVDINAALLDAIEQAVDDIVADPGLTWWPFCPASIAIVGTNVELTSTGDVTIELELKTGWNMVSVPVTPDNPAASSVFAGTEVVYTWNPQTKSYFPPTSIEPERSYWVAVISDRTISVTGTPVPQWESQLRAGWNMAGSVYPGPVAVGDLVDDPPSSIQTVAIYHWNPAERSYTSVSSIEAGWGYWVASIRDCLLYMS